MSLTVTKFMWKQAYCDSKASLSFCASGSVLLLQGYIENVIYWYSSTHCMIVHPQKCYGELRWVLRPPKYRRNYLACKMQEDSACNNGDSACNFISIQNIQEFCGVLDVQNPKPKSTPGSSTIILATWRHTTESVQSASLPSISEPFRPFHVILYLCFS